MKKYFITIFALFVLVSIASWTHGSVSSRQVLQANLNVYACATTTTGMGACTQGSDSNPCTISQPCETLQHLWDYYSQNYDLGGYSITLNVLGSGPYTLIANNGWVGGVAVNIIGSGSGVTTTYNLGFAISTTSSAIALGPPINIDSLTLGDNDIGNSPNDLTSFALGSITLGAINGDWAFAANSHGNYVYLVNPGAILNTFGNGAYKGSAQGGMSVASGAFISATATISCPNSISWSFYATDIALEGGIFEDEQTYDSNCSSNVSGMKFLVAANGQINPSLSNTPTSLPGSIPGLLLQGGIFVNSPPFDFENPSSGDTLTIAQAVPNLIVHGTSVFGSLTIRLPAVPSGFGPFVNGSPTGFSTDQVVTTLSVLTTDGSTIVAAPTTAVAGAKYKWVYNNSATQWQLAP